MAKFDSTNLMNASRSAEALAKTANDKLDGLKQKQDVVVKATRDFNADIEPTREAVSAAVKAAQAVGTAADDLASTLAAIPQPIPVPATSEPAPPSPEDEDGQDVEEGEDVLVRGKVVSKVKK